MLAAGLVLAGFSAAVSQVGFLLRHRGAVAAPDVDVGAAGLSGAAWIMWGLESSVARESAARGKG